MSPAAGPFATCSTRFFERSAAGAMAALLGEDGGKLTPAALERLEAILAQARTKFQKGRCLMLKLRVVFGMALLTICAAARWSAAEPHSVWSLTLLLVLLFPFPSSPALRRLGRFG